MSELLCSNVFNQINSQNPKDTHLGVEFVESHLQVISTNWMIIFIFKIRKFITTKIFSKINVNISLTILG